MKNFRKNIKGITLIALVVTIIVLLILTGVALSLAMGDNGLLHRTETATDTHQENAAKEKLNMLITACQIEYYSEKAEMPGISYLAAYLNKDANDENGEIEYADQVSHRTASLGLLDAGNYNDWTKIYAKLKAYPYEFEINDKFQLAKIDGVPIADSGSSVNEDNLRGLIEEVIDEKLSDYALKTDLNSYAKLTDIPAQQQVDLSDYATKTDVANAIKPYTNLTWTLIDSTPSSTWVKSSKSIEGYNYIAICIYWENGICNPAILSVSEFKKHNSNTNVIGSYWDDSNGAEAYYDSGLYMHYNNGGNHQGFGIVVYGIK